VCEVHLGAEKLGRPLDLRSGTEEVDVAIGDLLRGHRREPIGALVDPDGDRLSADEDDLPFARHVLEAPEDPLGFGLHIARANSSAEVDRRPRINPRRAACRSGFLGSWRARLDLKWYPRAVPAALRKPNGSSEPQPSVLICRSFF
jgi:hypothetical protein